ncbi:SDR family oxidoreductase [Conexibacter stalactiti]|uniref:SDR family oxidoreductase n=1 Tax=Conexibacter stalactiti TaxID=1940611 RepID=A0ABU4HJ00_9ACTN|nr:SDR family oxidoreductase [Conexibacter stalactiti]MDW5593235.1 SDR family oxidoreductase [Conexibacter stalactiti]MEC5033876.1 SDR family oxidoreductase [Conexibacter stalactiti]
MSSPHEGGAPGAGASGASPGAPGADAVAPVVLISGAAGGIGAAAARRFVAGGWRVALSDLPGERLDAVAAELGGVERVAADGGRAPDGGASGGRAPDGGASGDRVVVAAGDLRTKAACDEIVAAAVAATGRLDCLVSAAGVWTEGPAEETREEEWERVLDVNLKGLFFLAAAAIPHLARASSGESWSLSDQKSPVLAAGEGAVGAAQEGAEGAAGARAAGGSIVNLSSDAGIQGNNGAAVYCASKGGVSNLTRALALELAPRGIRVNAVCPGDVETPMLAHQADAYGGGDPDGYRRALLDAYPQREAARFTRPEEVAELIWYLAQPAAAPITGANMSIDFGLSAGV